MSKPKSTKPWSLAEAMLVEVEIAHPTQRQMHLVFQNGVCLAISEDSQVPLAAQLIVELRKIELCQSHRKGGRS